MKNIYYNSLWKDTIWRTKNTSRLHSIWKGFAM